MFLALDSSRRIVPLPGNVKFRRPGWSGPARDSFLPGLTLFELMVALVIIFILATMSVIAFGRIRERTRVFQARSEISILFTSLESERAETGRVYLCPEAIDHLPRDRDFSRDPWGRPYLVGPFVTAASSPSTFVLEWHADVPEENTVYGIQVRHLTEQPVETVTLSIDSLAGPVVVQGSEIPYNIDLLTPDPAGKTTVEVTVTGPQESGIMIFGFRATNPLPARLPALMGTHRHPYLLLSTGANREPGGEDIDEDIIWRSDYRDFQ